MIEGTFVLRELGDGTYSYLMPLVYLDLDEIHNLRVTFIPLLGHCL